MRFHKNYKAHAQHPLMETRSNHSCLKKKKKKYCFILKRNCNGNPAKNPPLLIFDVGQIMLEKCSVLSDFILFYFCQLPDVLPMRFYLCSRSPHLCQLMWLSQGSYCRQHSRNILSYAMTVKKRRKHNNSCQHLPSHVKSHSCVLCF